MWFLTFIFSALFADGLFSRKAGARSPTALEPPVEPLPEVETGLTTDQIAAFTIADVRALTTQQIFDLTPELIRAFTNGGIAAMTTSQIAAIESRDVAALTSSHL